MSQIRLSVIIPCFKDPYLPKTIDSLLNSSQLGDRLEIIPVLDGYWLTQPLKDDPRVRVLHLGKSVGPRSCINTAMRVARGEFVMRSDAHCDFGPGFDKIITESCQPNWIMAGIQYYLDPTTWTRMDKPPVIYSKLAVQSMGDGKRKFCGFPWRERDEERKDIMIDETMAIQGSVWVMPRSWWDQVIRELDNKYGPHYQDQHEMIFKTWKAGGKMMINKHTWYAHRHNKFPRTHTITHSSQKDNMQIFFDDWKDYYYQEIKPKWQI